MRTMGGDRGRGALVAAFLTLAGACAPAALAPSAPAPAGRITIGGSGAAYPAIKLVTDAFVAAAPRVTVEYTPSSSGPAGAQLLADGKVDLASLAQPLTATQAGSALATWPVATDGVAVAVHPSVALSALTSTQLRDIYSGKVREWRDLGVGGAPALVVLDRPEDETAKIALRTLLGPQLAVTPSALSMSKETDMVKAVETTPGAIGFFSLSYLVDKPGRARAVAIDGVMPSPLTIGNGTYPVTRPILVAARTADAQRSPLRELLAFLATGAATKILEAGGYGPGR